jgi:phenylpropionate dioxygenase-like ring-hydroxylating dioxygenase large terminal subunit
MSLNDRQILDSWYLVDHSDELMKGKVKKYQLGARQFLIFRDEQNRIHGLDTRCSHLRADLSQGKVKADRLICPLHAWEFDGEGVCQKSPNYKKNPARNQCIKSYTVKEHKKLIFIYFGKVPCFQLPLLWSDQHRFIRPFKIKQNVSWFSVAGNGFDINHFINVHDRQLIGQPKFFEDDEDKREINFRYRLTSKNLLGDKLLSFLFSDEGTFKYEVWGGNLILATAIWGNFENNLVISVSPDREQGQSVSQVAIGWKMKEKSYWKNRWGRWKASIIGYFSKKFFEKEAREIIEAVTIPSLMYPEDLYLNKYLEWVQKRLQKKITFSLERENTNNYLS